MVSRKKFNFNSKLEGTSGRLRQKEGFRKRKFHSGSWTQALNFGNDKNEYRKEKVQFAGGIFIFSNCIKISRIFK
jgi:hypothetical protein